MEHFIFSSSAAVYGAPDTPLVSERAPAEPVNPYDALKLMTERMLRDVSAATGMRHVILRYFNVAGADSGGRIGQSTKNATLLVRAACEAALGERAGLSIHGTDFPTPDGTGVRDYIHVEDLADAHILALRSLEEGEKSDTFNCGCGRGRSIREVIVAVERAAAVSIDAREAPRRPRPHRRRCGVYPGGAGLDAEIRRPGRNRENFGPVAADFAEARPGAVRIGAGNA